MSAPKYVYTPRLPDRQWGFLNEDLILLWAGITGNVMVTGIAKAEPTVIADSWEVWQSNGTGEGDAGDWMLKIDNGGSTKVLTLVDFSRIP